MQNYNDLKSNEAQFLSVVGVKLQKFNILVQFFEPCREAYISVYTVSGDYRRRIKKNTLNKLLVQGQDILIDGKERPILRPGDPDVQKDFYSGKKKPYD